MSKQRLATVWLDGCSGCHMSFLDMDERLVAIAELADVVYSPLVDAKEFPEERRHHPGRGRGQQRGRLAQDSESARARPRYSSRSATVRSLPMFLPCAIRSVPSR